MPHIHAALGEHDQTISAYIIRKDRDDWRCLVHMHRKVGKLMQIGGHIERHEGGWQSLVHELEEEAGYSVQELSLLQPYGGAQPRTEHNTVRPLPLVVNTHDVGAEHYHDDSCYGFIAKTEPKHTVADGESQDLRWLTLDELYTAAQRGAALMDCYYVYEFLLAQVDTLTSIPASTYTTENPSASGLTYRYGAASEQR